VHGAGGLVGVSAGLLLLTLARVVCWLNFLSLLATVRGGTKNLPQRRRKRGKRAFIGAFEVQRRHRYTTRQNHGSLAID
jgi:hypothetical protein